MTGAVMFAPRRANRRFRLRTEDYMPRHFGLKSNIGRPKDRDSNGADTRENPECNDICAKHPSSGQFCGSGLPSFYFGRSRPTGSGSGRQGPPGRLSSSGRSHLFRLDHLGLVSSQPRSR
jgi:hypothetical protein